MILYYDKSQIVLMLDIDSEIFSVLIVNALIDALNALSNSFIQSSTLIGLSTFDNINWVENCIEKLRSRDHLLAFNTLRKFEHFAQVIKLF